MSEPQTAVTPQNMLVMFLNAITNLLSFRTQAKKTDLSDSQSVRSLVGFIADMLGAFAKYTPTKIDDEIAVQLKAGVESDFAWKTVWNIIERFRIAPGLIVNDAEPLTPEMCEYPAGMCVTQDSPTPQGDEFNSTVVAAAGPQSETLPEALPPGTIYFIARLVIMILQKVQN